MRISVLHPMSKKGIHSWWLRSLFEIAVVMLAGMPWAGHAASEVVAWNSDPAFMSSTLVPAGISNVVAIAAGDAFSDYHLALTAKGRVLAWNLNGIAQTNVPGEVGNVVAIAKGSHNLALTAKGRVEAWGSHELGEAYVPAGLSNVVAIAAGIGHNLALTAEGRVVAWGNNDCGQTDVPSGLGNVVAIAAGGEWTSSGFSLALTADRQVVGWGATTVPEGLNNVVAISAGASQSLALKSDGRVVGWGTYQLRRPPPTQQYAPVTIPSNWTNVVAIAAGLYYSLALKADGQVEAWGLDELGHTGYLDLPEGLDHVVAIAMRSYANLALRGQPPGQAAPAWIGPRLFAATENLPFYHRIMVRNGATDYGATGLPPGVHLNPKTGVIAGRPSQTGTFPVVLSATNSVGSCEWTVTVFVNNTAAPAIGETDVVVATLGQAFRHAVVAHNAPEWYGASGLPASLTLDPHTGVISGMPLVEGDFPVNLVVSNRYGTGTGQITLRVSSVVAWGDISSGQGNLPSGLSNVVAIAASNDHDLALTAEGRVIAWGSNSNGQTNVPTGLSNVVAIAAGDLHSLALTAEGRIVAWGRVSMDATDRSTTGLSNMVAIAGGCLHTLALTAEGQVVACGWTYYGLMTVPNGLSNVLAIATGGVPPFLFGQALTAEGQLVSWGGGECGQVSVPSGWSNLVAIAAGGNDSLALTAEGRVIGWGSNKDTIPTGLSNIMAIAVGGGETSMTGNYYQGLALRTDGRVIGWGRHFFNRYSYPITPVPSNLSNVVAIATGGTVSGGPHGLALIGLPPGLAKPAWTGPRILIATVNRPFHHRIIARNGVDAYGAAGLPSGLTLNSSTGVIAGQPLEAGKYTLTFTATNRLGSCEWPVTLLVNGRVPGIPFIGQLQVPVGNSLNFAVTADNTPEWYGATGLPVGLSIDAGTGLITGEPVECGIFAVSLMASNQFGLGTGSMTIEVTPVVAWGNNDYGQSTVPSGLGNVVAIAAGDSHNLVLTDEGRVVGWGDNTWGQATMPDGLSNIIAISAGRTHSLALTAEGRVVGWGNNNSDRATAPKGLSNVVAISAGGAFSLALTVEGRAVAWGVDYNHQTHVPLGLTNVVAITAGDNHSLALTDDGRVVAWGSSQEGQTDVPEGLSNVVGIAAGSNHSLALTAEGVLVSWGNRLTAPRSLSNVVAIATRSGPNMALMADSRVMVWGTNGWSEADVSGGLRNVIAISGGGYHCLALMRQPNMPAPRLDLTKGASGLELQAQEGTRGTSYLLLRAPFLPGPWLPAEPFIFTNNSHRLRSPDASSSARFYRLQRN